MRHIAWLSVLVLGLAACGVPAGPSINREPADAPAPTRTPTPEATVAANPTGVAPTPASAEVDAPGATLAPGDRPPAGATSQFRTDFTKHSVPYNEILSGGPPKDGIPAIDAPRFVSAEEADEWLEPREPVILVEVDDVAKAYPIQIMMWHEIVNDVIGDEPVTVTFCPLCNTGIAFERTFDDQVLDFGTTGRLRFSNLVMYDRHTETWWQQATGEAIAGEYTGRRLAFVLATMISWTEFKQAHPDGDVLSRETGHARDYGRNPYTGYDDVNRSPFLYDGPQTPGVLPAMARVVTVELNGEAVAYPYDVLEERRVVNDSIGGVPIVVLWAPGTASALDAGSVAGGADVGAATTYSRKMDGKTLTFTVEGDRIVDEETGSGWDVLGRGVSGSLTGRQLPPVVSINHFWFSWAAFKPETRIYSADASSASPESISSAASLGRAADFAIDVYQGEDVLGGSSVTFSEVLDLGKPVVLNMWAGLCPVCRREMPEVQEAYEAYGDRVVFVGVDVGSSIGLGSREDALALLDDLAITYPTGSALDAQIVRDYQVLGTPATYFVSPGGDIVERWNGTLTADQLTQRIEELIEGAEDYLVP
jgi:thiol-disulfide isomerase/thioredoxin